MMTSQDPAAKTGTGEPKATQVGAELNKKGEVGGAGEGSDARHGLESS
ncbi:MAG: hypothetical protein WKF84_22325 [Pyrinomonadaceae bacterium]